jgi:hypothetical protein
MIWITCFSLALLLTTLIWKLRWYSLGHPGLFFSLAWIVALACYYLSVSIGVFSVYNQQKFDQLLLYVFSTAVSFLVLLLIMGVSRKKIDKQFLISTFDDGANFFVIFSIASVVAALFAFAVMSLTYGNLEMRRQMWLANNVPTIIWRLWYPYILCYPAALFVGWKVAANYIARVKVNFTARLLMIMPGLAGLSWFLATGGRQALGIVILYHICGFAVGWITVLRRIRSDSKKRIFKAMCVTLIFTALFAYIVSVSGQVRADFQGKRAGHLHTVHAARYGFLSPFAQFIDYMGGSIMAYQIRAELSPEKPAGGSYTFGVLKSFGLDELLGWEMVSRKKMMMKNNQNAEVGELASYATMSLYYDIQQDFGMAWGLLVCAIFTLCSQVFFNLCVTGKNRSSMIQLAPICIFLMLWMYSHQFSILKYDVLKWMLVSFIAWDVMSLSRKLLNSRRRLSIIHE